MKMKRKQTVEAPRVRPIHTTELAAATGGGGFDSIVLANSTKKAAQDDWQTLK
jgi:hypothetical protein